MFAVNGALLLHRMLGVSFIIFLLLQNMSFFLMAKLRRKTLIWVLCMLWLLTMNYFKLNDNLTQVKVFLNIDSNETLSLVMIVLSWNLLKCVSFSMERIQLDIDNKLDRHFQFTDLLGYSFYLPTMIFGPIFIYLRYEHMLDNYNGFWEKKDGALYVRFKSLIKKLTICLVWFVVNDGMLHYFHTNLIQIDPEVSFANFQKNNMANHKCYFQQIKPLDSFTLYGFGYLLGQFFHNKYVLIYGLTIALGNFDNIEMPDKPKCIGRVHLYSDMWKWFDRGLYEFLFKYVYAELCLKTSSTTKKLLAALTTFVFIYAWHGLYVFLLIWSSLNCICIVFETLLRNYFKTASYRKLLQKMKISQHNEYRLNAYLSVQVLIPSVLSNFIFFAGDEIGFIFFQQTYTKGFQHYLVLSIICYSIYHVCEIIKRYEMKNNKNIDDRKYLRYEK